jgi:signal transduction histidine kinase
MDEDILSEADFNRLRDSFRSQLKSLNILLDNTLNWAKSQMTGEIKMNKSHVNVHELILQNFELFKQVAFQKEIKLNHTVAENLSCFVDKIHLDIIIRNIISNAIKFTEKQGEILVQTEETTDFLNIDIIDNGIGMTKDQLSKLFSITQEQGNYGTAGESGAGIGLLLSNDFILKNGGKISVSSELKKGTKFTISLPKNA